MRIEKLKDGSFLRDCERFDSRIDFRAYQDFLKAIERRMLPTKDLACIVHNALVASVRVVCRVCGCNQFSACPFHCSWVEPDLCSSCEGKPAAVRFRLHGFRHLRLVARTKQEGRSQI
jgi:hypothetical protein